MDNYIKILVVISTFCIILWIQNTDDTKYKKERKSYYDKYSIPILVASITGLLLTFDKCTLQSYSNKFCSLFVRENPVIAISVEKVIQPGNDIISLKPFNHNAFDSIQKLPVNLKLPSF
jgi:hypothetical protein